MTRVALLWHMHQPFYQDLVTGEHVLPWVRMHALKDYYGMAAVFREFPGVKATFNLVPSLLVQLEAFAEDRARDRTLEVSLMPADALTASDVVFIREHFFDAQRERMIEPYPRYAELLSQRAHDLSVDDLRDLQVWHKLAWVDPLYLEGDSRVRTLVEKGRGYTEDDKQTLRAVELEILRRVVPEYRDGVARGQLEVSASPFYHPILPLLCDTDIYLRTHPDARRPRHPFARPEDAAEQLARAAAYHERLFRHRPSGLWPSEGSVSDAMVPLAVQAGFRWMATDELILARTLGVTFSRDGYGHLEEPEQVYAPFVVRAGGASIACVFRDHVLSDLIGFTYAGWSAEAAADDFVGRLVEAGRRFAKRGHGEEPLIPIILDGENAWEHFEGGGRPFLRALYGRLEGHSELRTVTMAEACSAPTRELAGIFPGSWIDANFYIWIGHQDDQRAWSQLADARDALAAAEADPGAAGPDADFPAAREEVLIAEGSDWCWWYGDDHSSGQDEAFDELFRLHLRNAYRFMGRPIPDELYVTNITTATAGDQSAPTEPTAIIEPTIDGEETSYFEWLGAGAYHVPTTAGSMHQMERQQPRVTAVRFGCSRSRLFVRVDGSEAMEDLLAQGLEVTLRFLKPTASTFRVRQELGRLTFSGASSAAIAAGRVLEIALPLGDLGVAADAAIGFVVLVGDASGSELERHPAQRTIELTVPDDAFEARNWRA